MTERKPHPDNALIDALQEEGPTPSQGSQSGGNVHRDVGTRAELRDLTGTPGIERARGHDNPAENAMKGRKTIERLDPARKDSSSE